MLFRGQFFQLFRMFILTVLSGWNLSYGAECNLPDRASQGGLLPSGYKHCNIQQQMNNYRKIYDEALEQYKNVEDLKIKPISGLYNVLANAYALVKDYIDNDKAGSMQKESYLSALEDSWKRAKDYNGKLTSAIFQGFNKNLAYIVEQYTEQREIDPFKIMKDNPLPYPNWIKEFESQIDNFFKEVDKDPDYSRKRQYRRLLTNFLDYIDKNESNEQFRFYGFRGLDVDLKELKRAYNGREGSPKSLPFSTSWTDPNIGNVIFIAYGNPKPGTARNISPFHFVEQFCNEKYPAYIAFFDILSKEKYEFSSNKQNKFTRKDPHWSSVNGTLEMLNHDFVHIYPQIHMLGDVRIRDHIKSVYNIQKNLKEKQNNNEATILIDGLFMIIHERPDIAEDMAKNPEIFKSEDGLSQYFEAIASKFKDYLIFGNAEKTLPLYGSTTYKQNARDWEFILKDKYVDKDGTIKPVHDEKGPFLPIEYNPELKKMTRPFNNEPGRNRKMEQALQEGYNRFWTYFVSIIKNNLPPKK